jgi:hypothetical protein
MQTCKRQTETRDSQPSFWSNTGVTDHSANPGRFRRFKLVALILVLFLCGFVAWNLRTPRQDPQIDAIRKAGYPVTPKELDEWYQRPPDAQNATLIYTNAFAKIAAASNAFDQITGWTMPKRGEPIATGDKNEFNALLGTNREPLVLLDSATALPNYRYPLDMTGGFNIVLSHLPAIKHAVTILCARAVLETAEGNSEAATQSFLSAGHLAGSLTVEPLLISQLVECANWAVVSKRTEWSLNAGNFSPDQLERLQRMFAAAENNAFYRGLAGERVCGCAVFDDAKSQAGLLANPLGSPSSGDKLKMQLAIDALKATGIFQKDRSFYLSQMSNLIAVAKLPYPDRFTASQNLSLVAPNKFYLISRMLLPALGKSISRDANRTAIMRVTETALAIERFRRSNSNSLPENLAELVPAYLAAVPQDPFDGKPLRFKKRDQGYVVYSVGSDLQDDGGAERDPKKMGARSDITFILEQ